MKINYYIGTGILILIAWSCTNPFSTRSPENPNITGNQQSFNFQTNRDSLLSKLRNSFISMDVTDYQECLADSFQLGKSLTFIPESRELNRLTNWDFQDEINYFTNLINTDNLQKINIDFKDFSDWILTSTSSDTQQIQFSYQIKLQFRTKTEDYQGRSLIKILRSSASLWYVFYWRDSKINSNDQEDTWSTLKANYRY